MASRRAMRWLLCLVIIGDTISRTIVVSVVGWMMVDVMVLAGK